MEVHDDAAVLLVELFLVVRLDDGREEESFYAERRLDDVGNIACVVGRVEVVEGLTAFLDMLVEVVVGSVGDAPQLAPAEREEVLKVGGALGVERKLFGIVISQSEVLLLDAEGIEEVAAVASPVVEPLEVGAGLASLRKDLPT